MLSTPIALNIIDDILGPADVAIPALHSPADGLGFLLEEFTGTRMRTMTTLTPTFFSLALCHQCVALTLSSRKP